MKLTQIFSLESILPQLKAKSKNEAMGEIATKLAGLESGLHREQILSVLMEREKLGSTGIGMGVAIPHGKLAEAKKIVACFARSTAGIDFEAQDGELVHLFFAILAPENAAGMHLKILAKLSRLLKEKNFRTALLQANDKAALFELFSQEEESF
ncbi:MAG: PTS sugar transporter subunit IIA [Deltaproteobacteria bacterium]|nr:PTS sugar transporter subunit IIA [Deltaproteobacteria bacterium]